LSRGFLDFVLSSDTQQSWKELHMLYIQDPSFIGNKLLHEALLEAFENAQYGAGAYAYVTAGGVKILMEDQIFCSFINRGIFHLIIGMDDVTNTRTLNALSSVRENSHDHLRINAYMHNDGGSTFHPKISWFKTNDGGVVVVGSGNLTQKGLRRNREAFAFYHVSEETIAEVETMWTHWIENSRPCLKNITDDDVIQKAEENSRTITTHPVRRRLRRPEQQEEEEVIIPVDEQDEIGAWVFDSTSQVLIAEIPGSTNNRWSQANFDADTFRNYFGAQPGVNGAYRLIIRNVLWDGSLGETKIRPTISVASQNYRIELTNTERRVYPHNGRPIGIFVKVAERTFLYMLIFPDQAGHNTLQTFIDTNRLRPDRLVRYRTTVGELQRILPALPLLYYLA
jgi:HKD family nuclease